MAVFVDTSAFFGLLDRDEKNHRAAGEKLEKLRAADMPLITSNYVVVETTALLQSRIGLEAVRIFYGSLLPLAQIYWVDERLHHAAMYTLLAESRRKLSLVDCTSFELMRDLNVTTAFALDRHFLEEGFALV